MRRRLVTLMLFASFAAPAAYAGPNANAKILIHLMPAGVANACSNPAATPPCAEIVTEGEISTADAPQYYFAFVLVTDGDSAGVGGVQFGIRYNAATHQGVDILGWTSCGTHEQPSSRWPADSSGILITWDSVGSSGDEREPETAGTAVAGYFYCAAYSPDYLSISAKPGDDVARICDETGTWDIVDSPTLSFVPSHLGYASFSSDAMWPGYNPCGTTTLVPAPHDTSEVFYPEGDSYTILPAHWPFQIAISENHALVIDDELFTDGDVITIDYDRANKAVTVNNRVYETFQRRPAPRSIRYSTIDLWVSELCRRFRFEKGGSRERVARALASMPDSVLEPGFEPQIYDNGVELRFKNRDIGATIDLNGSDEVSRVVNPERQARQTMKFLIDNLSPASPPALFVRTADSFTGISGPNALTALDLLKAGRRRPLTAAELAEAERLGILHLFRK